MKCINCHREISDTMRFCPLCGHIQPKDREAYLREHPELQEDDDALSEDEVMEMIKKKEGGDKPTNAQLAAKPNVGGPKPINAANAPVGCQGEKNVASSAPVKGKSIVQSRPHNVSQPQRKLSKAKIAVLACIAAAVLGIILFTVLNKSKGIDIEDLNPTDSVAAVDKDKETITVDNVTFTMIKVEGGTFIMGATSEQGSDADDDEKPAHNVTLSTFYMGETEVTQELWEAVMGSNPSKNKGPKQPVENVSWNDCKTFIDKLNAKTGKNFRMPTEAEWEFAARGGKKSQSTKYSGSITAKTVAWFKDNSGDKTHAVACLSANELGLYDMSGNVYEWCADNYDEKYYSSSPASNPCCEKVGADYVCRGGGFNFKENCIRVSYRDSDNPKNKSNKIGLRLVY
ncbi:MAG: SUMF1/EgtB/PvdO family nonheme iron enzyme [Muribaculaceae bacterium]|nr:SUMF1/EgtB/PvdO family nonheme iron enzyme [Muribaculaceae bacterium]